MGAGPRQTALRTFASAITAIAKKYGLQFELRKHGYQEERVLAAYQSVLKRAHPDKGGSGSDFRALFEAKAAWTSASTVQPAPAPPPQQPSPSKSQPGARKRPAAAAAAPHPKRKATSHAGSAAPVSPGRAATGHELDVAPSASTKSPPLDVTRRIVTKPSSIALLQR